MGLSPQSGSVNRRLQRCEHLRGGAPARAHGAVHVPVPVRGRLRPRPVNPVHRLPERLSEVDERARSEHGHRAPRFHTSADQLNSTTSVGESASSPKKWANCCRTASRRSPADRRSQTRASWPPMKPIITPGAPLSGDVSKVTFTGPISSRPGRSAPWPARTAWGRPPRTSSATPVALRQLVAQRRQRRLVDDAAREHGRDRDVVALRAASAVSGADERIGAAAVPSGVSLGKLCSCAGRRRRRTRCCRCCRSGRGRRRGRRRAPGCGPASAP